MATQIVGEGRKKQVQTMTIHAIAHRPTVALTGGKIRHDQALLFQLGQPSHHCGIGRANRGRNFGTRGAVNLRQVTDDLLRGGKPESGQCGLLIGRETRGVLEVSDHPPQSAVPGRRRAPPQVSLTLPYV